MNRKYGVLFILSILSVITYLDRNAFSVAGQRITAELGLSESQFGWILSAFSIAYAVFEIPTGWWGDKVGAHRILTRVVLWWSAFTALTGTVYGFASMFVVRFMFGAGEAGAFPNMAIAIAEWFPVAERGKAQAFIFAASRIGGALAPVLVIPLQTAFGWRTTFFILGIIGIIWALIWIIWYKKPDKPQWEDTPSVSVSGTDFWRKWLAQRRFWCLLLMYYCYASGVFFFVSWLPKYLQNGRGIAEKELMFSASLPFWLGALGCLVGGFLSDFFTQKYGINRGRRLVPIAGLCLSGVFLLSTVVLDNNSVVVVLVALGMAFMDLTIPASWAVATDMGQQDSGAISGAMNTAGLIGGTMTSVGTGYLVTWFNSYDVPIVILGVQLVVGGLLWLGINVDER